MSCYGWERGEIKLPSAVFSKFRRELNQFYNDRQDKLFSSADQVFAAVKAEAKGKRNFDYRTAITNRLEKKEVRWRSSYSPSAVVSTPVDGYDEIYRVLLPDGAKKLVRPKKKDFPKVSLTNNKLRVEEGGMYFQPEKYSVIWSVPDNNHAVETAREHALAVKFFALLSEVKWVRGTGGVIVGNDEYNGDSCEEGGGGNYVTARYGFLGGVNA